MQVIGIMLWAESRAMEGGNWVINATLTEETIRMNVCLF